MTGPEPGPGEIPAQAGLTGGLLTIVFVVVVVLGAVIAWLAGGVSTAEIGERAPQVVVADFTGTPFDLHEHVEQQRGPVVLNLWASWCEPCRREFPALSDYAESHPEVTVVGVAVQDQQEASRQFAEQMQPAFLVAWDSDNSVRDAYPSFGLPTTYLIDDDGTLVDIIQAELTPARLNAIDFGG